MASQQNPDISKIPAILQFFNIPHSFQVEKILRELYSPSTAYLMDGMNDIKQTGFAVAMERRFHYDLDEELGKRKPGFFFISAAFLTEIGVFSDAFDGIKIYFGLDGVHNDIKIIPDNNIKIIPILTPVKITLYEPQNKKIDMINNSYYVPLSSTNGTWVLDEAQSQTFKNNFNLASDEIQQRLELGGASKYNTKGYYIGKDVLLNILSDSEQHDATVDKVGIKMYFGIQDNILYYDYEKGKSIDLGNGFKTTSMSRDLHLIFVGVNDPNLGPLASFAKIFATIETDAEVINDGVTKENYIDWLLPSGMPCVVPDPPNKSSNEG